MQINQSHIREVIADFTGGLNMLTEPSKLLPTEFQLFENLILYKVGDLLNAIKRNGFNRYTTTGGAGSILNMVEFITNSKTTNVKQLLLQTAGGIKYVAYSSGYKGSITAVTGGGSFPSAKANMIVFNELINIIGCNTSGTYSGNKVYVCDDNGVCELIDAGIFPCPQTFNIKNYAATNSNIEEGLYKYAVTFIYDNNTESYIIPQTTGKTSAGSGSMYTLPDTDTTYVNAYSSGRLYYPRVNIAFCQIATNSTYNALHLTDIPIGNKRVIGRKIYRTKSNGTTFYHIATLHDNTTTEYRDTKSSDVLIDPIPAELIFPPSIHRCGVTHKDRFFAGYSTENYYLTAPDITSITLTEGSTGGSSAMIIAATGNDDLHYKYKFGFINIQFGLTGVTTLDGKPYSGYIGSLSTATAEKTITNPNDKCEISNLVNETSWHRRIGVWRNSCLFISNAVIDAPYVKLYFDIDTFFGGQYGLNIYSFFNVGDTIAVEDVNFTVGTLSGDYTILAVEYDSVAKKWQVTIEDESVSGSYISGTLQGYVTNEIYDYIGHTAINGTTFSDVINDEEKITYKGVLESNGINTEFKNKSYPSLVEWTAPGQLDNYVNSLFVGRNDGDAITGLKEDEQGIIIFKERSIYKMITEGSDSSWYPAKVVSGIGCSVYSSIVEMPSGGYLFWDKDKIYMWRGVGHYPVCISDKIYSIIAGLTFTNIEGAYDRERDWAIYCYSTSATKGNLIIIDYKLQDKAGYPQIYHFTNGLLTKPLGLSTALLTKDKELLFGSSEEEYIYSYSGTKYVDTLQNVSQAIAWKIKTKKFDYDQSKIKKLLYKVKMVSAAEADYIHTYIYTNEMSSAVLSDTLQISPSLVNRQNKNVDIEGKEFAIQLSGFTTNPIDSLIVIKEIGFEYDPIHKMRGAY